MDHGARATVARPCGLPGRHFFFCFMPVENPFRGSTVQGFNSAKPSDHGRACRKKVALVVSLVEEKAKREGVSKTPANIGGPGRTRTCNQTVMSGATYPKIAVFPGLSMTARGIA
jgi:hypothetical protein